MKQLLPISLIAASCLSFSQAGHANDFDIRISDDTVQGAISIDSDQSDLMFGMGYLYKDDRETINAFNVDLHAKGQTAIANMPTTVGIGFQGNIYKVEDFKGSAVGLGGTVRINLPEVPGVSLEGEAHYAPDILAFNDSDEFTRARVQANYRIIRSADISLGYRYLNAGAEDAGDTTLESGFYLGMKLKF